MPPRSRARLLNFLLLAASILAAAGAGEIFLRYFHPQPLEAAYAWPDGTLRHIPSFTFTYARDEFSNRVRFNALGLRGPEVPADRGSRRRAVFLGDSFVEGKQVSEREVLTAVLEELSGDPPSLSVINAGVAGTGTSEELILYDRFAASLRPDLVLLGFYPNDVRNNVDRRLFVLRDGAVAKGKEPPLPKVRWIYDFRKFFASRSQLFALVKLGIDAAEEEDPRERRAAKEAAAWRSNPLEAEEVFARDPSPKVAAGWDLTLALLSELKARVEPGGARFVLVVFPTRFQVDDALWRAQAARIGVDPAAFDLTKPQRVLGAWAAETRTPIVDLLEDFRRRNVSNTFYYATDAHWNAAGHRLAAERIDAGLRALGLIP
jgi:lysophospholipase L1-like esterase